MESSIGLYKTALIRRRMAGPNGPKDLELGTATMGGVAMSYRLQNLLAHSTPIEIAAAYVTHRYR